MVMKLLPLPISNLLANRAKVPRHTHFTHSSTKKIGIDELDSFMYQTVGHDAIYLYSECMEVPLYRREILGGSVLQGSDYTVTADDETEDLYILLKDVLVIIFC